MPPPADSPTIPAKASSRRRRAPRPAAVVSSAGVVVLAALAAAGWQASWPTAIFGTDQAASSHVTGRFAGQSPRAAPSPAASPGTAVPAAVAGPSTAASSPGPPHRSLPGPAATVRAYFAAINGRHYRTAWRLGGRNTGSSYATFAAGFAGTAQDALSDIAVAGNVVTVQLTARQDDGTAKIFHGAYTVREGAIVRFDVQQDG
jgi:hypothetical protein